MSEEKPKQNCWEFKQCGRECGGNKAKEICVCPASECSVLYDGRHGGHYAGRCCWRIAGTLCQGEVQGLFAKKIKSCTECDFYKKVKEEEGADFQE